MLLANSQPLRQAQTQPKQSGSIKVNPALLPLPRGDAHSLYAMPTLHYNKGTTGQGSTTSFHIVSPSSLTETIFGDEKALLSLRQENSHT